MSLAEPRYWAVIPAAGRGARMGAGRPKQYLELLGRTVLEHTVELLGNHPRIAGLAVVLAPDDRFWPRLHPAHRAPVLTAVGGAERCHSVRNGLRALEDLAHPRDWVLVHDAARPCLSRSDVDKLMDGLVDHPVGGLLAVPVVDTLKRANRAGEVEQTVPREGLWRAVTPQMFRLAALARALESAIARGIHVTDEAAAMEQFGPRAGGDGTGTGTGPRLIEGRSDNIKITSPGDLALAEFYLGRGRCV